jgi:hypothetical protein
LVETLIQRRDKIVRYYLSQINPLDEFSLVKSEASYELDFKNLGQEAGISNSSSYQYQWFVFDNDKSTLLPLGQAGVGTSTSIPMPNSDSKYLMVRIQTNNPVQPNWSKNVDVYVHSGSELKVVGIERQN